MAKVQITNALQRKLRSLFPRPSIARGDGYFHDGAVLNFQLHGSMATAEVLGEQFYQSAVDWSEVPKDGQIKVSCTCPFFKNDNLCKHLWALIVYVDAQGASAEMHFRHPLQLTLSQDNLFQKVRGSESRTAKTSDDQEVVQTKADWRTALHATSATTSSLSSRPLVVPRLKSAFVIEADSRESSFLSLNLYTFQLGLDGRLVASPRQMPIPQSGRLDIGDKATQSTIQSLATLARASQAQSNLLLPLTTNGLRLEASLIRHILPGLLTAHPFFASAQDLTAFLNGKLDTRLRLAQLGALHLSVTEDGENYLLDARLGIDQPGSDSSVSVSELSFIAEPDLYRAGNRLVFMQASAQNAIWLEASKDGPIPVAEDETSPFLEAVLNQPLPTRLPAKLQWPVHSREPTPLIRLALEKASENRNYTVELHCRYGSRMVLAREGPEKLALSDEQKIIRRDWPAEERIWSQLPLDLLIIRRPRTLLYSGRGGDDLKPSLPVKNLTPFVQAILQLGIPIDVENKRVQVAHNLKLTVTSGVDWFDVEGKVEFGGKWIQFPTLLEAVQRGERFVPLPDGSMGALDANVMRKLARLADFAESSKAGFRFSSAQGLLLNSLLDDSENVEFDAKFSALREKIKTFAGIQACDPVPTFQGELRTYQREGLGWLNFLEAFGLGGILADDMGLGKTVQCLAFLEERRQRPGEKCPPTLLLVPKSLLPNWQAEAKRFAPGLRVMILSGLARANQHAQIQQHDLVVTTYQTMLRDREVIQGVDWDCVILDEAQAIKNPDTLVAKTVRTLNSQFRLAMTGTPIENSIQDLFSISDFVNPGFLRGKSRNAHRNTHLNLSEDSRQALTRAFKPVILRRTKDQVLKDLPAKIEQTIHIELEPKQRKLYNELKKFYKTQLLREVEVNGVNKSQIQILAALTRLRQAALHPGLIDPEHTDTPSAKFDVMLEMLEEVIAEGHRVLIFSQFTGLLALLKVQLEARQINFSYLDGKTKNRGQVVDEFKTNGNPVFLISLKAGGVGLNLVDADYVFLLDPWWNPAVETQAIDRAHRIGQTRTVNAYRFISTDTVEEKILELQKSKLRLSTDLLSGQSGIIKSLTAQDIENLLS